MKYIYFVGPRVVTGCAMSTPFEESKIEKLSMWIMLEGPRAKYCQLFKQRYVIACAFQELEPHAFAGSINASRQDGQIRVASQT
jgi:hypothetical protein